MITRKEYDAALKYLDSIKCDMETDQDIRHSIAMEKSRIYAYQQKMDMAISALEEAKAILIEKNEFDIEPEIGKVQRRVHLWRHLKMICTQSLRIHCQK